MNLKRLIACLVVIAVVLVGVLVGGASTRTKASAAPSLTGATPVAGLTLNPPSGTAPVELTADGSRSTDDIGVTSYTFNWGDGSSTGAIVEKIAKHVYSTPGDYVVTLTVTDADSGSSSTSKTLTVSPTDPTPPPNAAPVARVTATPRGGSAPLAVNIDGGTSTDDKGITKHTFDFGDGSSTVPQPASFVEHNYSDAGTYTIRLRVVDEAGLSSTATTTVTVNAAPEPPPPATTKPTTVSFTFDDTFADQIAASSVLDEYGMKGTFYVNSTRISTSSLYMSRAQTDALFSSGHEIAGHTLGHVDLATATDMEARRQICDDRVALTNMGYPAASFAYPFGSTSTSVKQAVSSCGYSSARGVGNLRSPGYGCNSCATAETIPPVDKWQIETNSSVRSDTTVEMLQTYVEQAEQDVGGWVPLVFHHICTGCATNSMDIASFRRFVDWLSKRPSPTQVRTVNQVMGGAVPPTLSEFGFTPKAVDVNAASQNVVVTARVTVAPDAPGAKAPSALITSDNTTQSLGFGPMTRVSGNAQDGIYQRTVTIPTTAAPGSWTVKISPLEDTQGNSDQTFHNHPTKLTVTNTATPASVPGAPTGIIAVRGVRQATVKWTAPAKTGGAAITKYTITSTPGGIVKTVTGTVRSLAFTGLANGTNTRSRSPPSTVSVLALRARHPGSSHQPDDPAHRKSRPRPQAANGRGSPGQRQRPTEPRQLATRSRAPPVSPRPQGGPCGP